MTFTYARPDADSVDGGWTNEAGSQTNLYASIDETSASDADYIASSPSLVGDPVKLSLSDVGSVSNPTTVRYRYKKNDGGDPAPVNMQAALLQGSTVIASWQHNDISTSYTLAEQSLSSGEFSAISDLTNLFLQFQTTWWLTDASIDLDFSNARYYDSSDPTVVVTDFLSCSRASIGYAKNADGTLTSFGNDALRITSNGLLVEDARTNYALQSADANTTWTTDNTSITVDQAVAPDGNTVMDKISDGTNAGVRHIINQTFAFVPALPVAGETQTVSVFVKDVDRRYVQLTWSSDVATIGAVADLQTGTITQSGVITAATGTSFTSATIEAYNGGVYRFSLTGILQTSPAISNGYFQISLSDTGTPSVYQFGSPAYTGSNKSIYVWGMQYEVATFPSSYIPTSSASATRAADVVTCIGSLDTLLIGNAYSEVVDVNVASEAAGSLLGAFLVADSINQVGLATDYTNSNTKPGFRVPTVVEVGNVFGNSQTLSGGVKIGAGADATANTLSLVGGGSTVATFSPADVPLLVTTNIRIGNAHHAGNYSFFGYFRRLTFWNSKVADATLQALTAP